MINWESDKEPISFTIEISAKNGTDFRNIQLELPTDDDEMIQHLSLLEGNSEVYNRSNTIGYEGEIELGEIEIINTALQELRDIDSAFEKVMALKEYEGTPTNTSKLLGLLESLELREMTLMKNIKTEEDLGKLMVDEYYPELKGSDLEYHIDYESYGRDQIKSGEYFISEYGTLRI